MPVQVVWDDEAGGGTGDKVYVDCRRSRQAHRTELLPQY